MPFDDVAPGRVRTLVMPWAGRNAPLIAAREATPLLPPGWGSTFRGRLRYLGVPGAAPTEDDALRALATGMSLKERLLGLLHALAQRGGHLPGTAELCDLLDVGWERAGQVSSAFTRLHHDGLIVQHVTLIGPYRGGRVVRLCDTGQHLRTATAPPDMVLA